MRNAIAAILAAAALAGCESSSRSDVASLLRHQVDLPRDRAVWLTSGGVEIYSAAGQPVAIELPGWVYAGAPHCPPDMAIGPKGEVVVTSNVLPTLWRIDPQTHAVSVHALALDADMDKDVGFAAVVFSAEQGAFLAYSGVQRSVWKIDPALKTGTKLVHAELRDLPRARNSLNRPCKDLGRRLSRLAASID